MPNLSFVQITKYTELFTAIQYELIYSGCLFIHFIRDGHGPKKGSSVQGDPQTARLN